jgi:hypothetical protein
LEVRSGAGSFHVSMERVEIDHGNIVLFGTVDEWDSRTIVSPDEAVSVFRLVLRWPVVRLLARAAIDGLPWRRHGVKSHDTKTKGTGQ